MTRRGDLLLAGAAGLLSLVGAVLVLRLWRGDLGVPLEYFGDVNLQHLLVRLVHENLWFYENGRLGAPAGLELYDYPVLSGETLNVLVVWLLGLFGFGSAGAMNVFYVLTYPAAGVAAYLVLRRLGAEPAASLVCSVLYALAPYHFIRGETHLWLSAYYAVPVGAYLALRVLGGERGGLLVLGLLAALVAVASGSFYYSAFTVLLVVAAMVLRWNRGALLSGGLVVGVILAVSLVQLAPTIVYRAANGQNEEVAKRFSHESEVYAGKLSQLVFPVDGHRIEALARMKERYSRHFPPGDARAATLGVVATGGFVWLLAVSFGALVGRRAPPRHLHLAVLTLTAFLFATVGGLGVVVSGLWAQTRAWNRLSIFIAFFALAAVALGLTTLRRRLGVPAYAAVLAAVLLVGLYDQTSDAFVPDYAGAKAQWAHDRDFFRTVEDQMLVQLPYEPFPEPPTVRQAIYETSKGFLHTDEARWSWGAMRGREEDWLAPLANSPAAEIVAAARDRNFEGIVVDRIGYLDDGAAIEPQLTAELGAPRRSPDGRFLVYRL